MEWVETTGKTLAEALDRALDQLGVDEADLEHEVLAEPRAGLFGRRKGEARIRARVKPLSREKPVREGRARGRVRSERKAPGRGKRSQEASTSKAGGRGRGGHDARETRERSGTGAGDAAPSSRSRRRRSRGRRGSGSTKSSSSSSERRTEEKRTVDDQITVNEQADMAVEFARGLVEAFGADAEVTSTLEDDENVLVEIVGEDLGLLVGPKGATLAAVEELVRTVVQRGTAGGSARIHVDVAGYRSKRREALAEFATKLTASVLETGTDKVLEPMPAADRKVVHDVVAEIDGVETTSEGDEPRRRVVIRRA